MTQPKNLEQSFMSSDQLTECPIKTTFLYGVDGESFICSRRQP